MLSTIAIPTRPWSDAGGALEIAMPAAETAATDITPEGRLLERYRAGDDGHGPTDARLPEPAFWVARHLVGNDEVAMDLVNDAFVKLLNHYQRYDPTRPFKAWFLRIVRNLAIDHLRRAKATASQDLVEMADAAPMTDTVEQTELQQQIREVMSELPESYRELLVMREVEGLSPQEIATVTDTDYGTTRWRIHQALASYSAKPGLPVMARSCHDHCNRCYA